jgi:DNA-binding NarL/FixJ family response regulator
LPLKFDATMPHRGREPHAMANAKSSPTAQPSPPPTVPPTVVVVLRCTLPPPLVRHLFAIGAAGYLPADTPANTAAEQWIAAAADVGSIAEADPSHLAAQLSPRELDVVRLIGAGQSTRAIAAKLYKSIKTIETYRSRIKTKLRLKTPTELAQWAWRFVHATGKRAA